MKVLLTTLLASLACLFVFSSSALGHCEIPCGIYDDPMRIALLEEHISTIEKSMGQIKEIQKENKHDANQLVRWVSNKEDHASQLQEIVSQYFMTQRLKVDAKNYEEQITLLHQLLISAMKTKQTTDETHVAQLKELLGEFEKLYFAQNK